MTSARASALLPPHGQNRGPRRIRPVLLQRTGQRRLATRLFINYPFSPTYVVSCASTSPCLSASNPIPVTFSSSNLPTAVYQPLSDLTPNIQEWNFTLERQITEKVVDRARCVMSDPMATISIST